MNSNTESADPAAIFACALSLRDACMKSSAFHGWDLSECFHGGDEFLRQMMRIGQLFESWACKHVVFEELTEVWPYLLEDHFGTACLRVLAVSELPHFAEDDCLRVANQLRIPVQFDESLFLPLDLRAANPVSGSAFAEYRIRSVWEDLEDHNVEPIMFEDDPADDNYGPPFLAFYGVSTNGEMEHIKDFARYADAVGLALKIAPGIQFPEAPVVVAPTLEPARG